MGQGVLEGGPELRWSMRRTTAVGREDVGLPHEWPQRGKERPISRRPGHECLLACRRQAYCLVRRGLSAPVACWSIWVCAGRPFSRAFRCCRLLAPADCVTALLVRLLNTDSPGEVCPRTSTGAVQQGVVPPRRARPRATWHGSCMYCVTGCLRGDIISNEGKVPGRQGPLTW